MNLERATNKTYDTTFTKLDYYPEPDRSDVYNFSENVLTRDRENTQPDYDFRIGASNVTQQNDQALVRLPITSGVQLVSVTSRKREKPERVKLWAYKWSTPYSYNLSSENASYFFKSLLLGSISNQNTMLTFAYEYWMVANDHAIIQEDGSIQTMAKVPKEQMPTEEMKLFCGNLARAIWGVIHTPCTFKNVAYEQWLLFNDLFGGGGGHVIRIKSATSESQIYPVRESDFANWVWSTNIWRFITANDVGLKYKARIRFLATIMGMKYGKKPQTRGEFSSCEQQSKALIPDDDLPTEESEDGLWYQHQYFDPWIPTLAAVVLRLCLKWANDIESSDDDDTDYETEDDGNQTDDEGECSDMTKQRYVSELDNLRTVGDV